MTTFRLPYHFYPIRERDRSHDVAVEDVRTTPRLGHHRYAENTLSGRVICRLVNETEIFVGAERNSATQPATVKHYELDGKPAIPATTLRGLISSLAEAASNSAARVLSDDTLSFRKDVGAPEDKHGPLSAIGMVVEVEVEDEETGKKRTELQLRPLCLPTLEARTSGGPGFLPEQYATMYAGRPAYLKVYLGSREEIRQPTFPYRTFYWGAEEYYGLRLRPVELEQQNGRLSLQTGPDLHYDSRSRRRILSQKPAEQSELQEWPVELDSAEASPPYVRGIIRTLGVWNRQIPRDKKHELFLPYPEEAEQWPSFPFAPGVIDRFHDLADQRTDAWEPQKVGDPLPYEPRDTVRSLNPDAKHPKRFRLKAGDLVYFRPSDDGEAVAEISLSAIWRGRVETLGDAGAASRASARDFFAAVDPDLVPFHPGRERITPAEQVFGFVSSARATGQTPLPALAGRVRFSAGILSARTAEEPYENEVRLKVLATPKPPSPALYFRPAGSEGYIKKADLRPGLHHPQGRKVYLRHEVAEGDEPWRSTTTNPRTAMMSKIKPLRREREFFFHIDFDNLTPFELGMLCYALRPTEDFRHKLGMGKPLGLGTVRIDPLGIFYIDRHRRYGKTGFFVPRYHERWLGEEDFSGVVDSGYEAEARCSSDAPEQLAFDELCCVFADGVDPIVLDAIEWVGEHSFGNVAPPLLQQQHDPEHETYRWFVANDRAQSQSLEPLDFLLETMEDSPAEANFPSLRRHR